MEETAGKLPFTLMQWVGVKSGKRLGSSKIRWRRKSQVPLHQADCGTRRAGRMELRSPVLVTYCSLYAGQYNEIQD